MATPYHHLDGTPMASLQASVAAELASGAIPYACPHPATADTLELPRRILACDDCVRSLVEAADAAQPPGCACCGNPATRTATWVAGTVFVVARLCDPCGTAGSVPVSPN